MVGAGEEESLKDLKACLNNLKMDEKSVAYDTSLAKEYLKKYNSMPRPCDPLGEDMYGNKLYKKGTDSPGCTEGINKNREIAVKMIDLLERNTELLAQLDYLIRGTNPEYIKKVDLPILINSFKSGVYGNVFNNNLNPVLNCQTKIGDDDPMAILGSIANQICYTENPVVINPSANTTIICSLFLDLCQQAGISENSMKLVPNCGLCIDDLSAPKSGCIAVVTSKCDIDSAIGTLMSSTQDCKYPWKLCRILVQENVYDKFKSNLALMTLGNTQEVLPDDYSDLRNSAMDLQIYEDKILIFEYIGQKSLAWQKPIVLIEAYRTTKELLSLLLKYPSKYLSLWCNDVSTTNEVTSKCNAQLIWINNIADFQGSIMLSNFMDDFPFNSSWKRKFNAKTVDDWMKKSYDERKIILLKVFCGASQVMFINRWKPRSFYEIGNGKCISGTQQSTGYDLFLLKYFILPIDNDQKNLNEIVNAVISSLLIGNCILMFSANEPNFEHLHELGVPIKRGNFHMDFEDSQTTKYKLIISYYGESFAN